MTQSPDTALRLAFLDLDASDRRRLAELKPLLERHADSLVAAFYRHLLSFEPTREKLRDPAVKERLLQKQREYLLSLAEPGFDERFVAERRRIGEVHERIGLEPRWYLSAYALYLALLTPVIYEGLDHDPARVMEALVALQKLLCFDTQLAMEAYIERDKRELRYLADELAEEGRQLSRDYRDRTTELRQTEERARASEQLASVGTLVAGLAHEIGTPMNVIQGHARLLERGVRDDDSRWRLRTIQEQIARISKIIQTLLNMARPGAHVRRPVELEPLLETTLSFLSERLARRRVALKRYFARAPSVRADPERLQQLFLNLFLNAVDAMPDGGELSVELELEEGGVRVRVRDTGVGIRAADLPRVFDPFFSTKEAGHGNGLGLMVARDIAVEHGGSIEVSSAEGKGTEFAVLLPVAAEEGSASESPGL